MTYLIIAVLAFSGFIISAYIHHHKAVNRTLVCPIHADCSGVIHSDYSKFFGISVERIGIIYYFIVFLVYLLFTIFPTLAHHNVLNIMLGFSLVAFLFSFYLVFVQIFILKKLCSWCIFSAIICIVIFILNAHPYFSTPLFN